ncbi:TetR/AcrR family transcriptional regulator [Pseudomonas sp. GD03858]|uniref:TetR/AcrR family transcriptional regulator n=1 Tax=unclassified Pseudomonas TaxID=196821 RepID=UPI00244C3954|nr:MULTISPECIES: helix-turn-helix domain containing protein [unclassified Pseudomonas]MDH0645705.1 TetR/AcrR family transcriptional regulator [Pseudomonas sp. GD03867]MDH0661698.1 TetR/AcrR family transcriptional regulator [Pseudomonas sp. GD03858]
MVRRTRAEMEQTRATLLAMARKVFSEQGYANTSMDDLTARAGLTRGALYHHFGDKQGLLAAVVAQIDGEVDERLNRITVTAEDAWEGFQRRCRTYLEMAVEPDMQRIVLRDARAVLGAASHASHQQCLATMQRLVRQLVEGGVMTQADPRALAALIYGSLAEAAQWIAQGEDSEARLEQGLEALRLLLRGLLAHR